MIYNPFYYFREHVITISISLLLVLVVINSTVSFLQVNKAEEINTVNKDISEIKSRLNAVNTHVNLADMSFRGFMVIEDKIFLDPLYNQVLPHYGENYDTLRFLLGKYGFETNTIPPVKSKVASYIQLIESMVQMRKDQEIEEIISIMESDPGFEIWKVYSVFVDEGEVFVEELAAKHLKEYEKISLFATISQILMFAMGFPTLLLTIFRIKKNNELKKRMFNSIELNNKQYIFDPNEQQRSQDEKTIIENLIQNLKKISVFIKGITGGNYDITWEGLNQNNVDLNKENIVGDLINMREQMKTVKEQDERRLWATEGISKFSEIVRSHQNNIDELCFEVISNLVKYVKANQGGVFVLNESNPDDAHLELVACYAYSRKKFLEKRIEFNQGLVGQAYLEEDIIYMTDLPEDYISIKSGLGDANPNCILIIPLKYNDRVEAIIELASFSKFKQHEIDLVQKIGEYVASAIASVKVNVKTRELLENSQEQAEHMRTQEEEMRQNMEELQATQEEVQRRTLEYQQIIESNNVELEALKEKVRQLEKQEE